MECLGAPNVYIHSSTWRKSSSCCLAKTTAFLNYVLFRYRCEILVRHTHYLATLYTCRLRQSLAKVVVKIKCLEWSFQTSHCSAEGGLLLLPSSKFQWSHETLKNDSQLPSFFLWSKHYFFSRDVFFFCFLSKSFKARGKAKLGNFQCQVLRGIRLRQQLWVEYRAPEWGCSRPIFRVWQSLNLQLKFC